jgi:predicted O-methyltransferase YrrM
MAIARIVYCMTLHKQPEHLLETGVARGITTRLMLEAIAENRHGHLWSIDLPPPGEPELREQIGIAVPDRLRSSWTYVTGSSRRRLRPLLSEIGSIDLFVHDSRHTQRNLTFELHLAWAALTPDGAVVVDDVDLNCGFHAFRRDHPDAPTFVGGAEPLEPDLGRQNDTGVVAIALKPGLHAPADDRNRSRAPMHIA